MWLTSSSVGRKFIMAVTGACLVLFITFHCLMNSVAIVWPASYNTICEILGANWYALVASLGLAVLFIIHICYAVWLTLQNRKARGNDRYAISRRPATVEWSSQNMLVLGIVILAFLVVHLIQFWAKMQLAEIRGIHSLPPAAGTLFLQEAFSLVWTPIVYIIGFVALWFHMNHGFWSMFQSVGWDSTAWIERWKKIGCWWTTIVVALFIAQAIVFTVNAHRADKPYLNEPALRNQYMAMAGQQLVDIMGPQAEGLTFDAAKQMMGQIAPMAQMILPQAAQQIGKDPKVLAEKMLNVANLINYLEGNNSIPTDGFQAVIDGRQLGEGAMMPGMQAAPQQQAAPQTEPVNPADAAEAQPATDSNQ